MLTSSLVIDLFLFFFFPWKGSFIEAQGPWTLGRWPLWEPRRSGWRGLIWPSWGAGCWFGCICSSWQCRDVSEYDTCGRSSCPSCISEQAGGETAGWCHLTAEAPSVGWTLFGYCSLTDCGHSPAVCQWKSDSTDQVGSPPCLLALTFSVVSLGSTSCVVVLLVRVLTKICTFVSAVGPPHWKERGPDFFVCFALC